MTNHAAAIRSDSSTGVRELSRIADLRTGLRLRAARYSGRP
ncbi:MAG TPA: hypothetical protein PKA55_01515 [Rhodoblastus sp.]|nr:hypothetical protein [Rhodoblastus sp.]